MMYGPGIGFFGMFVELFYWVPLAMGGKVHVSWSVGEDLEFTWREEGGPPVHVPDSRGFRTRMIERTLSAEFGGKVELEFVPTGVVCRVVAPIPAPIP